jgi:hypothetical protein
MDSKKDYKDGKLVFRLDGPLIKHYNNKPFNTLLTNKSVIFRNFDDVGGYLELILKDFQTVYYGSELAGFNAQVVEFFKLMNCYPQNKVKDLYDYVRMQALINLYHRIYFMYTTAPEGSKIQEKLKHLYTFMRHQQSYVNKTTFGFDFLFPDNIEVYDSILLSKGIIVEAYHTGTYATSSMDKLKRNYCHEGVFYIDIAKKIENPIISKITHDEMLVVDRPFDLEHYDTTPWDVITISYKDNNLIFNENIRIQRKDDSPIICESWGDMTRIAMGVRDGNKKQYHYRSTCSVIEDVD